MRKKNNKIIAFSLLALCFACLAFGVYALKNATLTTSGTVGFTAHDCLVNVVAEIEGDGVVAGVPNSHGEPSAKRDLIINEAENSNEMLVGGGTQADWNKTAEIAETIWFTDLTETGAVAEIVMTFTLTNQSAYSVTASIANAEIANVRVGASEEITLEKGAQGVLTATFNLDLNANGEYPEINNLPFEVKLDFRKAGSTGGEVGGGDDVVTGVIDVNNLPQTGDKLVELFESNGFTTEGSDPQYVFTKGEIQYMIMTHSSKDEAQATLDMYAPMMPSMGLTAGLSGNVFWATNDEVEVELTALTTPTTASYNQETNTLTVGAVENATGYIVNYYKDGALVASEKITSNESVLVKTNTLTVGTAYDVKVIAVGDGVSYGDSVESEVLTTVTPAEISYVRYNYFSGMMTRSLFIEKDENGEVENISVSSNEEHEAFMFMTDKTLTKSVNGNATTFTWPDESGQYITINKNDAGEVTSLNYFMQTANSTGENVHLTGLITRDVENNCNKITITYDSNSSLYGYILVADNGVILEDYSQISEDEGAKCRFTYDVNGNVVLMVADMIQGGQTVEGYMICEWEYDDNNNCTRFTQSSASILVNEALATYDEENKITQLQKITHQNPMSSSYGSSTIVYEYDENDKLVKTTETGAGYYPYDGGNISYTEITNYVDGKESTGSYEKLGENGDIIQKYTVTYLYENGSEKYNKKIEKYTDSEDNVTHYQVWTYSGSQGNGTYIYVDYDSRTDGDKHQQGDDSNYSIITGTVDEEKGRQLTKTATYYSNSIAREKTVSTFTYDDENNAYTIVEERYSFDNGVEKLQETVTSIFENGECVERVYVKPDHGDPSVEQQTKIKYEYEYNEKGLETKETITYYMSDDSVSYIDVNSYEYHETYGRNKETYTRYSAEMVKQNERIREEVRESVSTGGSRTTQETTTYKMYTDGVLTNTSIEVKNNIYEDENSPYSRTKEIIERYNVVNGVNVHEYTRVNTIINGGTITSSEYTYYNEDGSVYYYMTDDMNGNITYKDADGNVISGAPGSDSGETENLMFNAPASVVVNGNNITINFGDIEHAHRVNETLTQAEIVFLDSEGATVTSVTIELSQLDESNTIDVDTIFANTTLDGLVDGTSYGVKVKFIGSGEYKESDYTYAEGNLTYTQA